jgi:5,10-methylenetetrahydromethanopterin reductase
MRNTWVLTSAVATMTRRVQIGGVGINPYTMNPCEIATYAATLDELSEGRCIIGLGMHTDQMVEWTGIDAANHIECTRESVTLIRQLLRGDVARSNGPCFPWTDQCYLRFKPFRANIPIYVSSFGAAFHEVAGEIGDGAQPMITPPASASLMVRSLEKGIERAKRDRSRFVISGCGWLSLSEERAAAADRMKDMVSYFGPYLEDEALATVGLGRGDFAAIKALTDVGDNAGAKALVTDDMLKLGIVGTPRDVIRQIEDLAAVGIDEVGLGGPLGPDPDAAIELLGREVIPYFRSPG